MNGLAFEDGHYVYWLRDDYGALYVGYTKQPRRRIREHRLTKPWFKQVTNVEIKRYQSKGHALKTEAFEILFGECLNNIDLNEKLADVAFDDARSGQYYPILERYVDVPVRRF